MLRKEYPLAEQRYCDALYQPDCDVTEKGVEQSRDAGVQLRNEWFVGTTMKTASDTTTKLKNTKQQQQQQTIVPVRIHVIVSPLRRALQTAHNMLKGANLEKNNSDDNDMVSLQSVVVHPAAAEVLRDPCDIGSPVRRLREEFRNCNFDFARVDEYAQRHATDGESWWGPEHLSLPETWRRMRLGLLGGIETDEQVQERLQLLREYICQDEGCQKADIVIVVCHSETIWWLSAQKGPDDDWYGIWAKNGEIIDLTSCILENEKTATSTSSDNSLSSSKSSVIMDERYTTFNDFLT